MRWHGRRRRGWRRCRWRRACERVGVLLADPAVIHTHLNQAVGVWHGAVPLATRSRSTVQTSDGRVLRRCQVAAVERYAVRKAALDALLCTRPILVGIARRKLPHVARLRRWIIGAPGAAGQGSEVWRNLIFVGEAEAVERPFAAALLGRILARWVRQDQSGQLARREVRDLWQGAQTSWPCAGVVAIESCGQ